MLVVSERDAGKAGFACADDVPTGRNEMHDVAQRGLRDDPMRVVREQGLATRGQRGYWEKVLEFSQSGDNAPEAYISSYGIAILYARLGDNDKALESLEQAYTERQPAMTEIGIEPALDPLRADIRFHGLLNRLGLIQ